MSDRITVLRYGRYVGTVQTAESNPDSIIRMTVGMVLGDLYPRKSAKFGRELLRVEGLSGDSFCNGSFTLRQGEILGFFELVGSGRTEATRELCGIDRAALAVVFLDGRAVVFRTFRKAIDDGLAYLTEDRKTDGLFPSLSIRCNISSACLRMIRRFLLIDGRREGALVDGYVVRLNIKLRSSRDAVTSLSGGNQQKVMIARWLAVAPAC